MAPGARSKFGAPMLEPKIFRKRMYCIEESTCDTVGTFRRDPHSFGAPIVIRCPGHCTPLVPSSLTRCIRKLLRYDKAISQEGESKNYILHKSTNCYSNTEVAMKKMNNTWLHVKIRSQIM